MREEFCSTDSCAAPPTASVAITSTYPARAFAYEVSTGSDSQIVTLFAVPGQYHPSERLTLFRHMVFTVTYTLPTTPSISIGGITVNQNQLLGPGRRPCLCR